MVSRPDVPRNNTETSKQHGSKLRLQISPLDSPSESPEVPSASPVLQTQSVITFFFSNFRIVGEFETKGRSIRSPVEEDTENSIPSLCSSDVDHYPRCHLCH